MEAGADFQQAGYPSIQFHPAGTGLGNAAQYLEQGAFPGPIAADNADPVAGLDIKIQVFECPKFFKIDGALLRAQAFWKREYFFNTVSQYVTQGDIPLRMLMADEVFFA